MGITELATALGGATHLAKGHQAYTWPNGAERHFTVLPKELMLDGDYAHLLCQNYSKKIAPRVRKEEVDKLGFIKRGYLDAIPLSSYLAYTHLINAVIARGSSPLEPHGIVLGNLEKGDRLILVDGLFCEDSRLVPGIEMLRRRGAVIDNYVALSAMHDDSKLEKIGIKTDYIVPRNELKEIIRKEVKFPFGTGDIPRELKDIIMNEVEEEFGS